jgi:hypothetical protein
VKVKDPRYMQNKKDSRIKGKVKDPRYMQNKKDSRISLISAEWASCEAAEKATSRKFQLVACCKAPQTIVM